jgi:glycerol-3-phosphate cytidylyltransferase-like family protein
MDKWYGLTMADIRELEKEIKKELDIKRYEGVDGSSISSSSDQTKGNLSGSKQSSSSFLSATQE